MMKSSGTLVLVGSLASFGGGGSQPSGSTYAWTTKINQTSFTTQNSTGSDDISKKILSFYLNIPKSDYGQANELRIKFRPGTQLSIHHGNIGGTDSAFKYCINGNKIPLPLKCDETVEDGDYVIIPLEQNVYDINDSLTLIAKISNTITSYNKYSNPDVGFYIGSNNNTNCQSSNTDHPFDAIIEKVEIRQKPTGPERPHVYVYESSFNDGVSGWGTHDIRIISPNPVGSRIAKVRITMGQKTGHGSAQLSAFMVGVANSATDYNWKRTPQQLTFNGSSSVTIADGSTITSDWIDVDVEPGEFIMVAYHTDINATLSRRANHDQNQLYWKNVGTTPETSSMSVSGYSSRNYVTNLLKIEVQTKADHEWVFLFDASSGNYTEGTVYKLDLKNIQDASFWANLPSSGSNLRIFDVDGTEIPIDVVGLDKSPTKRKGIVFTRQTSTARKNAVVLSQSSSYAEYTVADPLGRNAVWSDYATAVFFENSPVDRTGNNTVSQTGYPSSGSPSHFSHANIGLTSSSDTDHFSVPISTTSSDLTIVAGAVINSDSNASTESLFRLSDGTNEIWGRLSPGNSSGYVVEVGDSVNTTNLTTLEFDPYVGQRGSVVVSYGGSARRIAYDGVTSGVASDTISNVGLTTNKTLYFGVDSNLGNGLTNNIISYVCLRSDTVSDGWLEYQSKVLGWSPTYCLKRLFTCWHRSGVNESFSFGRTHRLFIPFSYFAEGNWIPEVWAFLFDNKNDNWSLSDVWVGYADSSVSKYKFIAGTKKQIKSVTSGGFGFSGGAGERDMSYPINLGPPQGDGILISMYNDISIYNVSFTELKDDNAEMWYGFWRSNVVSADDPGPPESDSKNNGPHFLVEVWGR